MQIIKTIEEFQDWRNGVESGLQIGFTPTMGALHEGHLAHIRSLRLDVDVVVASVYVNPSQFAPGEDFEKYPRDLEGDGAKLRDAGCDILFYPTDLQMYPSGYSTYVSVEGITSRYEGSFRPSHFRGVATIVCKLLNIVRPHVVTFGEKDAQQVAVIQRMVADLNMSAKIRLIPTLREVDGLAMSSRNVYLSESERREALTINRALNRAKELIAEGEDVAFVEAEMRAAISPEFRLDYFDIIDPATFDSPADQNAPLMAVFAGYIGTTRLIDNVRLR
ncbi:MAG: pantoate--beta-alanine ligase [Ignavibacteriae bacterium]|nr:pantoate--beta-alanine ligase [Ignavibacteriota bacterium]MCB9215916.1 pantoate--beta-alanine ligase [Ignavibacteria bacterium]